MNTYRYAYCFFKRYAAIKIRYLILNSYSTVQWISFSCNRNINSHYFFIMITKIHVELKVIIFKVKKSRRNAHVHPPRYSNFFIIFD